jgi:protein-arginine kinase activator protein McsA
MDNPTIDMKVTLELKNVSPEIASVVDRIVLGDLVFVPAITHEAVETIKTVTTSLKPVVSHKSQGKSGVKTNGVCKKCGQEFSYIRKTGARKYCDDCQPAASKAYVPKTPKPAKAFGARGATPGIDSKAAAALNKHHLGAKLSTTVGD